MKGISLSRETQDKAIKIMKKYKVTNEDGNYDIIRYNPLISEWRLSNIPSLEITNTEKYGLAIWGEDKFAGIKEAHQRIKRIKTAIKILQELKEIGVPVKE